MAKGVQDSRYAALMERLAAERRAAGLSQAEVAARLEQRQQYVSKYESGERRLDVVEFLDVVKALGADGLDMLSAIRVSTDK